MKILYILFIFGLSLTSATSKDIIALKPKLLEKLRSLINKCLSETNAPPDSMTKMLQGNVENETSLDFAYCYLTQAGFIEKDSHFNIDKLLTLLEEDYPKEEFKKAFEDCNKISGKDHIDTLRLMAECYKENSPVTFVLNAK